MELTAVPATQFSSVQLTDILNACFEAYLVPVTQSVEGFVQRFSAEGMSLVDSRVWLAGDEPAAIAIVARRGSAARLAAFALRPAWRDKGLGRKLMQELLMLQQQGIETVFPEVIRDNHAAVALYQSLGFTRRYGLCGYLSTELLAPVPGVLQLYPTLSLLRRAIEESNSQLPWLLDPPHLRHSAMSGRDAGTARLRGSNDGGLAPCTVVFVGGARRPPPGAGA